MYTLQTILLKLRQHKPELQRKYPISRLGVFGSYARGEATKESDIDIAVEITGPMGNLTESYRIYSNVLITFNYIPPVFLLMILQKILWLLRPNRLIHEYFGTDLPLV